MPATNENAPFRAAVITHFGEPWTALPAKIDYIAFGRETCPSTQRVHFQTWAYANRAMRLSGWKKVFPGDHIEQMRGTFAQNDAYCSKESQLTCFGVKPMENGKKRTLADLCSQVVEAAEIGQHLSEVVCKPENQQTFVQYNNGIQRLYDHAVTKKARDVPRDFAPMVTWVFGPPGCGKTRYVYDVEPNVYRVPISDKYKWKDGYTGQEAVLYDNITPTNINPVDLLTEIDRYFVQVPKKGGFVGWRPRRIYFTSLFGLELFSLTAGFDMPAEFTRRVTGVVDAVVAASRMSELENEIACQNVMAENDPVL